MSQRTSDEIDKVHQAFVDALEDPICKHAEGDEQPYVFIKDLGAWPIRHFALDWRHPSTFLTPRPLEEIHEMVREGRQFEFTESRLDYYSSSSVRRAQHLIMHLKSYYLFPPHGYNDGIMSTKSGWYKMYANTDDYEVSWDKYTSNEQENQDLLYSFAQAQPPAVKGKISSHFIGLATPGGELIHGSLSIGELGIIVRWASLAMKALMRHGLNAVSITLISAWGTQVRVVAAEVSFDPPYLTLGITRPITTPDLFHKNDASIQSILSWCLSTVHGDIAEYKLDPDGPSVWHTRLPYQKQSCTLPPRVIPKRLRAPPFRPRGSAEPDDTVMDSDSSFERMVEARVKAKREAAKARAAEAAEAAEALASAKKPNSTEEHKHLTVEAPEHLVPQQQAIASEPSQKIDTTSVFDIFWRKKDKNKESEDQKTKRVREERSSFSYVRKAIDLKAWSTRDRSNSTPSGVTPLSFPMVHSLSFRGKKKTPSQGNERPTSSVGVASRRPPLSNIPGVVVPSSRRSASRLASDSDEDTNLSSSAQAASTVITIPDVVYTSDPDDRALSPLPEENPRKK